ncbi:hypothetical protein P4597_27710 [Peribacillus simplex]|uniref:hypothetical protein n=1 Tax=Peribacillus simplex TaxID=1478 RepID=UPI002E1F985C|nr:hypothetical protein [Peribacillus simplex]
MNILFDLKLNNNEVLNGVYFLQYQRPIKSGKGSILMWGNDSLRCFNKNDEEMLNLNINDAELIKAYDQQTGMDVTEFYVRYLNASSSLSNPMSAAPIARDIVRLEN